MISIIPKDARPCNNTYIVDVTPEMAQAWLDANNFNRPKRPEEVAKYARQIREGRWKLTHQGLAFTQNGTLLAEYTPLPEGQHLVEITQSQSRQTKAGDGSYLELEYTVVDGEHKGALHWDRLCLTHPNPKAVGRANAALSAICHAIGVMTFTDTVELHHIPFQISIRHRTDDNGRVSAEVAGYAQRPMIQSQFTAPQGGNGNSPSPWSNN